MYQHEIAQKIAEEFKPTNLQMNEATTRARIIDTILNDILSCPKNAITCEEHISEKGYADYILKDQNNDNIIIIEAKKEGISFNLPTFINKEKNHSYIKIETLLTDSEIAKAIKQVRSYALETGTQYAAITNGHVWIFFSTFSSTFKKLNAFVIHNLDFFAKDFTLAYEIFNYNNIIKNKTLQYKLQKQFIKYKETYSVKDKIHAYSVPVDLNEYAQYITKPVKYFFGDFAKDDKEFLENCYVDERLYENTKKTLANLLVDNATPYLENNGVKNYERSKLSSKLSKKITNFIEYSDNKHIVVIYGDRGCGKSTFIKKLIYSDIPESVQEKLSIIYINLLDYAASKQNNTELKELIWKSVLKKIDVDSLMEDFDSIQNLLFKNEFDTYKKQLSSLYGDNKFAYGDKIEQKIKEKSQDYNELALRLATYLREYKKHEIVLILDNTDQFSSEVQDFCFQVLAEIYSAINCLSIITIREERFFRSKKLGVLDAYETTQYHISSPRADKVFLQRLNYFIDSLNDDAFFHDLVDTNTNELLSKEDFQKYFRVFQKDFHKKANLYSFLVACAQKDMRKALDLFRELVVSGYMNINEILSTTHNTYTLQVHQVLKPIMTPQKYFYEEDASSVPNILKLRFSEHGSHFTSIRILKLLNNNPGYESLAIVKSELVTIFGMEEDFNKNIAALIEYKLIEANIKVDEYIPDIEDIIITPYGKYFIERLIHFFTYLDLICTDCDFYNEETANFIAKSANEEYRLFTKGNRGERLQYRIKKTNAFIEYLVQQEKQEKEQYNLSEKYIVMNQITQKYSEDIDKVKKSALRQTYQNSYELENLNSFFETV